MTCFVVTYASGATETVWSEASSLDALAMEKFGLDSIADVEAHGTTVTMMTGELTSSEPTPEPAQEPIAEPAPIVEQASAPAKKAKRGAK